MKVALVCDWLTNVGGAEKVILEIHKLFPDAPIYTSKYDPKGIDWFKDADVRTGWLQKFPTKLRRILGPLRQIYFSHLDLSDYDLVISITGAEAKSVKAPNGIHISYCHVPTQYYWQMYDDYIKNPGFGILNPIVRFFFRLLVIPLRRADLKAAQSPDYFVTISEYAKEQIKKYYGRDSVVIHPPVELEDFKAKMKRAPIHLRDGFDLSKSYVVTSRQVNWKRVDLAVRAGFLSQRHIVIIGEGPEHKKLVKMAKGSNLIQFLPLMKKEELARYLGQARGFIFPSLEPFGIAPVEALAAGCPVVAFGEGGANDYIQNGKNGVLFSEQTPISLAEGILELEKLHLDRKKVAKTVDDYGLKRFDSELMEFVDQSLAEHGISAESEKSQKSEKPTERPEKIESKPEPKKSESKKTEIKKSKTAEPKKSESKSKSEKSAKQGTKPKVVSKPEVEEPKPTPEKSKSEKSESTPKPEPKESAQPASKPTKNPRAIPTLIGPREKKQPVDPELKKMPEIGKNRLKPPHADDPPEIPPKGAFPKIGKNS